MVRIIIGLILFQTINCFSQDIDYKAFTGTPVKVSIPVRLDQPYFCLYRDSSYQTLSLRFQNGYSDKTTPENIILSAYCGSINELSVVPKYSGPKPDSTQRNGLILIHKLTFFWQGKETSVVKFCEMKDSIIGKPISVQLQKDGNEWQQITIAGLQNIEKVVLSIRSNIFWEFYNKKSDIPAVSKAYMKVKDEEGLLNIDLLCDYLNQLRKADPTSYSLICDN